MKKMKNKVIALIIVFIFLSTSGFYVANRVNASDGAGTKNDAATAALANKNGAGIYSVGKDETVYVNLNYDGTVSKMNVVNYFRALDIGIYQDYGNYENVINLTNEAEPVIDGDSIRWDLTDANENFYYQGQLTRGELPWTLDIEYKLAGATVKAEDLAGASGEIRININVEENKAADEYFRQNYMMQITVPFNMQNSTLISAPGAVQMIAGHTKTLAFTVLPQTAAHFEIIAQVEDFSMEAIDIAMMKADLSSYMDVTEMTEGFGTMSDGMEGLSEGTVQLKDGISELSGGIGSISDGLNELSLGTPKLSGGMNQFEEGLTTFAGGLKGLASGSSQMKEGLQGLNDNGSQLLTGYQGIEGGMASILANKQELSALAGEMVKSTDPQTVMLAQALLGQLEGLTELQTGLNTLNTNLDLYTQGVKQTSDQYDTLNTGINSLPEGFKQLTGGYQKIREGNEAVFTALDQLNEGLSGIDSVTAAIPEQVQKLVEGQTEMKAGIDQAVEEIKLLVGTTADLGETQAVSFAAPGKIVPNSVQFVLRTPAIEKISMPEVTTEVEEEQMGFWEKLFKLF